MTVTAGAGEPNADEAVGAGDAGTVLRPPDTARAVPTRQATAACSVVLAGRRTGRSPVAQDRTSSATQTVVHNQVTQHSPMARRPSQWTARIVSNDRRDDRTCTDWR